jgi:hypothetical protein
MTWAMSEERRDQAQEEARRVLSPVRLAVLLLLGALFLVVGGSRADAAEAEPAPDQGPHLVAGTLAALDADEGLTAVGATVDGLVDPVLTATEPVVEPVLEPVVGPVVEPVVAPLRPVVEQVVPPLAGLPVTELVAPAVAPVAGSVAGSDRVESPVRRAPAEGDAAATAAVDRSAPASATTPVADGHTDPAAPVHGTPESRSTASSSSDGGAGAPVPYAVLLTAFAAVLLFAGGVAPRRVAPPLAPTFLPPVFPG